MRRILLALLSLTAAFALASCGTFVNPNETYCAEGRVDGVFLCSRPWSVYFDTTISLTLYVTEEDDVDVAAVFDEVEATLAEYHEWFDKYHEYEGVANLWTINRSGTAPTAVDPLFYDAIAAAFAVAGDIVSGGFELFNPALGPVLSIWHDARESDLCAQTGIGISTCPVPDAAALSGPFNVDPDDVILDPVFHTVTLAKPGMSLDFGGFAKGYVSEILTDRLDAMGVDYLLNAGNSNVKAGGVNPNNDTGLYYIALTKPSLDPFSTGYYVYLKVPADVSVVTSGNYQRFFYGLEDGAVYHHIVDPRTYRPGGEAMAVTILIEDGAKGDAYSTAIYLLSIAEGLAFVEATPGLEAVWYLADGSVVFSGGIDTYVYEWLVDIG